MIDDEWNEFRQKCARAGFSHDETELAVHREIDIEGAFTLLNEHSYGKRILELETEQQILLLLDEHTRIKHLLGTCLYQGVVPSPYNVATYMYHRLFSLSGEWPNFDMYRMLMILQGRELVHTNIKEAKITDWKFTKSGTLKTFIYSEDTVAELTAKGFARVDDLVRAMRKTKMIGSQEGMSDQITLTIDPFYGTPYEFLIEAQTFFWTLEGYKFWAFPPLSPGIPLHEVAMASMGYSTSPNPIPEDAKLITMYLDKKVPDKRRIASIRAQAIGGGNAAISAWPVSPETWLELHSLWEVLRAYLLKHDRLEQETAVQIQQQDNEQTGTVARFREANSLVIAIRKAVGSLGTTDADKAIGIGLTFLDANTYRVDRQDWPGQFAYDIARKVDGRVVVRYTIPKNVLHGITVNSQFDGDTLSEEQLVILRAIHAGLINWGFTRHYPSEETVDNAPAERATGKQSKPPVPQKRTIQGIARVMAARDQHIKQYRYVPTWVRTCTDASIRPETAKQYHPELHQKWEDMDYRPDAEEWKTRTYEFYEL